MHLISGWYECNNRLCTWTSARDHLRFARERERSRRAWPRAAFFSAIFINAPTNPVPHLRQFMFCPQTFQFEFNSPLCPLSPPARLIRLEISFCNDQRAPDSSILFAHPLYSRVETSFEFLGRNSFFLNNGRIFSAFVNWVYRLLQRKKDLSKIRSRIGIFRDR